MSGPPQSKRPKDTPLYQQRLPAWQPILTPQWVILTFLLVGVPFVIIGFVCLSASNGVVEVRLQYDGPGADASAANCSLGATWTSTVPCQLSLTAPAAMNGPVYVYYELTNFYQNHRRYVKSRDDPQLEGLVYTDPNALALIDCDPLITRAAGNVTKLLHPCGLVANSYFNDTFKLSNASQIATGLTMDESGIAWTTDLAKKFAAVNTSYRRDIITYITDTYPDLTNVNDEHFIVWMRPAALPSFRKLYGRFGANNALSTTTIASGQTLTFNVNANYPVQGFSGTKSLVITTLSFLGGKNAFLGDAYIVTGFLLIGMAGLFAVKQYVIGGRKLGDAAFLMEQAGRR